ncbi:MAG: tRNA uridine-5-carboxymethylaminomethyl(34) synthesis GTPase MnmE [Oscillospiraceae bacterium]|nr:tRNA uridine-5-carboxymethylaminomethyl(34) synthesis GTPase MnmE [Oscillospiraceae bacterium]
MAHNRKSARINLLLRTVLNHNSYIYDHNVKEDKVLGKDKILNDTIAAISTAQGNGGIGIVRISGSDSLKIAEKMFKPFDKITKISSLKGYTAKYGKIIDKGNFIDEAVILVFKAPNSYTGENVAEISCHGGLFLTRRVLRVALELGARLAKPGEFTKRAFLNGKMGLVQAESVMDLIYAKSEKANKIAFENKEGNINRKISILKDKLIDVASKLAVWSDYPDEEVFEFKISDLSGEIENTLKSVTNMIKTYDFGQIIKEGIKTVIVGKPNVGKSTLMNLLSGSQKAIVTDVPGTTRDAIEETIMLGGISLRLIDTAGIRDTQDIIEKIGVDKSKNLINSAELIFAVLDGSKVLEEEDKKILNLTQYKNRIIIINKIDLPQVLNTNSFLKKEEKILCLSAKNESSLDNLKEIVYKSINKFVSDENDVIISNERHLDCLKRIRNILKEATDELKNGITLDAITVLIEESINILNEFTGESASKEIVDRIFSKFCVGK